MSKKLKCEFKHSWKYYAKKSKKYLKSYCMVGATEKELKKRKAFREKWGFGYEDAWSLDEYAAALMLPRFAYLRDHHQGTSKNYVFRGGGVGRSPTHSPFAFRRKTKGKVFRDAL